MGSRGVTALGTEAEGCEMAQVSNHTIEAKQFAAWHQRCEKDERPHITLADVDAVAKRLKAAEKCATSAFACTIFSGILMHAASGAGAQAHAAAGLPGPDSPKPYA